MSKGLPVLTITRDKKKNNTENEAVMILAVIGVVILLIIGMLYVIGCAVTAFFGMFHPGEITADIYAAHSGRVVTYWIVAPLASLIVALLGVILLAATKAGGGLRASIGIFLFILTWIICGWTIDPAFTDGYDVYVLTNEGAKHRILGCQFLRPDEKARRGAKKMKRFDGFDLVDGARTYHVALGKLAWMDIQRTERRWKKKVLWWTEDKVRKTTTCMVNFKKDKKFEGQVAAVNAGDLVLKGKNTRGGAVELNVNDILQILRGA